MFGEPWKPLIEDIAFCDILGASSSRSHVVGFGPRDVASKGLLGNRRCDRGYPGALRLDRYGISEPAIYLLFMLQFVFVELYPIVIL